MSSSFKSNFLSPTYTLFLENHPLPAWLVDAGDLQIYFANKAAIELYNYPAAEFSGKAFLDLFTAESRADFLQKRAHAADATKLNGCYRHVTKTGKVLLVELFASAVVIDNKNVYQLTVLHDMSRNSVQQDLEEEVKRYKTYIENSSAGIFCQEFKKPISINASLEEFVELLRTDGAITECNKALAGMYGFDDPSALIGLVPSQLIDFDDLANIEYFKSFIDNGFKVLNAQSHEKDRNGHSKYFLNNAVGVVENGFLKRIWGTQIDVTENKQAEKKFKESEKRFKEVADSAPVMIWMSDENDSINYLNKKWVEFTGENLAATQAPGWFSFLHPDDYFEAKSQYETALQEKKPAILVYRLRSKDGTYRWVHDTCIPRFLSDKRFVGYIGSVIDIEEQKRKEEQLRYQATIMDNVSDIIITSDLDDTVRSWNKTAEEFYGIPAGQAIGKSVTQVVQLDYQNTTRQNAIKQIFKTGIWKGEVAYQGKNGEKKYVLNTISLVVDETGEQIGILTLGRDITDRKKAEEKLRQSEAFYRTMIADSLDGVLLVNEYGKISFCSPSVRHVLGYEAEEVEGRNGFEFVHPEDMAWAFQSFQKEVEERPEIKFITVRLLHKNGQWVWCMVRGHNLLANPNINSLVVYFHDDTLRKQTSDALKESEKRFRSLIRDLQVGVFLSDKDGHIIMCNKALSQMLSVPEEMIIGKNVYDILADDMINEKEEPIPHNERPLALTVQSKQMVKEAVIGVFHPITKERSWVIINADPILDDNGEIKHVVCSVTDITGRKKLEQKLMADQLSHQKQLTQATIDGQEAERREIGKELHDNIGQQLTTIKLFLDMVKSTADDVTIEMANMALKGVSDVINEIRSMSRALVPYTLKDLGLVESIRELVDAVSRAQLTKIDFVYKDFEEEAVPENQKLTLFRIVQEQLNNIAKHAEAKNVSIAVKNTDEKVLLEIKDDGKGFSPKKVRNGLGITNIRNRAELFGGSAQVLSQPGKGCTLKVSIPLSHSQPLEIFNSYN
jgi:PAS domain S-box-containing protein